MNIDRLIKQYINEKEPRERRLGRYWASELYSIITGKFKPEDFFEPQPTIDLRGCSNIIRGMEKEETLKLMLEKEEMGFKHHIKKEIKHKGFVIVVECDFLFKDKLIECKSPYIADNIKEYHYPQLEAQYRAFKKPVYVLYVKDWNDRKEYKYAPSDKRWEEILNKVEEFHKELCQSLIKNGAEEGKKKLSIC